MSPRKKYCKWSKDSLEVALRAIRLDKMSVKAASSRYGIPRRTLGDYVKRAASSKVHGGRRSTLSNEEEQLLVERMTRLADVGFPMRPKVLKKMVFEFCEENEIPHQFNETKKSAGKHWLKLFLKRHPDLSLRKAQHLNEARARKLNKVVVSDYFNKLQKVMVENDLMGHPERIFNMDEKGCQLSLHKQPQVLAKKGSHRVHYRGKEHGENVTIVGCSSATGVTIPPMIIFKGQRRKEEWGDNLPAGCVFTMTAKGSMTTEVFQDWLEHLQRFKPSSDIKCLLILDGASCHISLKIAEMAERLGLILFFLPSNTTHELQPLDKSVFKPFESFWDDELMLFWSRTNDAIMNKQRFGLIFTPAWDKATSPSNVRAGFEACGIYPFNPNRIPEEAFAPAELTEAVQRSPQASTSRQDSRNLTPRQEPSKKEAQKRKAINEKNEKSISIDSSTDSDDFFSDSSSEEYTPEVKRQNRLKNMLRTPQIPQPSTSRRTRKAFNSSAMVLNKKLFIPIPPATSGGKQVASLVEFLTQNEPQQSSNKPKEPSKEPLQPSKKPLQLSKKPQQSTNEPQQPSKEPKQSSKEPQQPSKEPPQSSKEPQQPSKELPQSSKKPQQPSKKPQQSTNEPQQSSKEPQQPSKELPQSSKKPQKPSKKPQQSTNEPQQPSKELPQSSKKPQQPSKKPQQPSKEPQQSSKEPQQPSKELPQSSKKPQQPSKELPQSSKKPQQPSKEPPRKTSEKEAWYCFVCEVCEFKDMRACNICARFAHEECIGFTKDDDDLFVCPSCE
ncbi:hypothetical protein M8J77_011509 [Diaphorina citri]|nr:hypothetical protein M8J77_011509 [Diaphorina citri]